MDDLIAFLRARLGDARERANFLRILAATLPPDAGQAVGEIADQINREADAQRQLIDWCDDWTRNEFEVVPVLCWLALAHAGHPDYQPEEWKP